MRDDDKMPGWWWAMVILTLAFWAAVIYVAVHFIARWW